MSDQLESTPGKAVITALNAATENAVNRALRNGLSDQFAEKVANKVIKNNAFISAMEGIPRMRLLSKVVVSKGIYFSSI